MELGSLCEVVTGSPRPSLWRAEKAGMESFLRRNRSLRRGGGKAAVGDSSLRLYVQCAGEVQTQGL